MTSYVRGIRNNNPGNIRVSPSHWQGELPHNGPFERFENPVMGIRAMMRLLLIYQRRYRLLTIRQIINRWAPPNENNTVAYHEHVARELDVTPDTIIDLLDEKNLINMAMAIVLHENGRAPVGSGLPRCWYDYAVYQEAAKLALECEPRKGK